MTNLIHLFVTFLQFTAIRLVAREKTMVNCNYRRPWSIATTVNNLTRVAALRKFTESLSNKG